MLTMSYTDLSDYIRIPSEKRLSVSTGGHSQD